MGVFEEKANTGPTMHWQQTSSVLDGARGPSPAAGSPAAAASPRACCSPPAACAGCARPILDRFYLQAVERRWHAPCLRCCQCNLPLDSELTCFARDSNIYCKKDYLRLFGTKRCARCQAAISASELVMRARDLVFHVRCFSCALCGAPLTKGDTFGMRESAVYCRLHYETMPEYPPVHMGAAPQSLCATPYGPPHHYPPYGSPDMSPLGPPQMAPGLESPVKGPFFNGASAGPPRQKGRPRKKKPKDLEAMTANLDLTTEYLDMGFNRSGSSLGGSSRTKRMRTSFKHHQLRTMKSYFAINHNPDAKDLKQLSQKTGLPKRVLQVWFQNARAKWRRMMSKQESKMGTDKCPSEGGLELDSIYPHGPGSMAGSIQSLPPHSPPYSIMAPGSPSSLDCA